MADIGNLAREITEQKAFGSGQNRSFFVFKFFPERNLEKQYNKIVNDAGTPLGRIMLAPVRTEPGSNPRSLTNCLDRSDQPVRIFYWNLPERN